MEATDSWPALQNWFRPWSVKQTGQLFYIYQYRKPNQKIWRKKSKHNPPSKKQTETNPKKKQTNKNQNHPSRNNTKPLPQTNKKTPQQQTSKEKPYNT